MSDLIHFPGAASASPPVRRQPRVSLQQEAEAMLAEMNEDLDHYREKFLALRDTAAELRGEADTALGAVDGLVDEVFASRRAARRRGWLAAALAVVAIIGWVL